MLAVGLQKFNSALQALGERQPAFHACIGEVFYLFINAFTVGMVAQGNARQFIQRFNLCKCTVEIYNKVLAHLMCGYADLQMCGFFKLILKYVYKVDRVSGVLWKKII